jgi:hypothetical protein
MLCKMLCFYLFVKTPEDEDVVRLLASLKLAASLSLEPQQMSYI